MSRASRKKTLQLAQASNQIQEPQFDASEITAFSSPISEPRNLSDGNTTAQGNRPCEPVTSYVNKTALSGIHEDLKLLHEISERITGENAKEYAQSFSLFYKNQKSFYDNLGKAIFYKSAEAPQHCRANIQSVENWVLGYSGEINTTYATINKYAVQPNQLVQQVKSDLTSIILRLEEILEKLDK